MVAVELLLLGDVQVRVDGQPVDVGTARQRCVLAVLAAEANRPVPADRLVHRVWAEHPPQRAHAALAGYVSRLRRVLPADGATIRRQPEGYVLVVDPVAVDVHRFQELVRRARAAGDGDEAANAYDAALGLWRGEPFATLDTPWVNGLRTALGAHRLAAELDRNDLALRAGRHAELLAELTDRAAAHPLDERLAGQLILALYRSGRQAEALAHFDRVRLWLAEELGADPSPPLRRLHAAILRQDAAVQARPAPAAPARRVPNGNLSSPLTSFIGRGAELAGLRRALARGRLVTLTGVGGVGKSRLALEAARAAAPDHRDGAWLVELASVTQPGLVAPAVATMLGLGERPGQPVVDQLVQHLHTAEMLIVLDNCDHLVGEVATFANAVLTGTSGLRILATSRERLGITGEAVRPVAGLAVPAAGTDDDPALGDVEAVRLLVERASGADPEFQLSPPAAAAAAHICRRLDGLPLAIELAAAGVHALGIGHISAHLDDRFRLLSHGSRVALPRHRTLRAAVDWSYGLLREPERRLFDRLAVFVGGFDLDAVGAVWSPAEDGPEAADTLLTRLVDTSLVAAEAATATTRRFRMLETLRAYGLERLGDRGEAARWRDRHAAYVLALVESARTGLRGDGQAAWLRRLATEHGNIRAALAWSHERGDAPTAVRLAGSLYPLWDRHGHYSEGRRWLSRVLAMPGAVPADVRARAWESAAGLAVVQGDLLRATEAGERAAALSRQAGDPAGEARALQHLGLVAVYSGEPDAATAVLDLSLAQARAADDEWLRGWSLLFMAIAALARAQYDRTTELSAACEAVLPASGDPECRGWALTLRAAAAWRRGEPMAAIAPMSEGLRVFQELGHLWGLSVCFLLAAQLAGRRDDALTAATLLGASETLRGSVGAALLPFVRPWLDEAVVLARDRLGPGPFDRAWRAGAAAPVAASAAMAIGETDPPGPAPWA